MSSSVGQVFKGEKITWLLCIRIKQAIRLDQSNFFGSLTYLLNWAKGREGENIDSLQSSSVEKQRAVTAAHKEMSSSLKRVCQHLEIASEVELPPAV